MVVSLNINGPLVLGGPHRGKLQLPCKITSLEERGSTDNRKSFSVEQIFQ
jgi:hypothetical protein